MWKVRCSDRVGGGEHSGCVITYSEWSVVMDGWFCGSHGWSRGQMGWEGVREGIYRGVVCQSHYSLGSQRVHMGVLSQWRTLTMTLNIWRLMDKTWI